MQYNDTYYLCPALITLGKITYYYDLKIKKRMSSIKIINAWEITSDDVLAVTGIMPGDKIIIPSGKTDLPIIEILNKKREYEKRRSNTV
jgi:hypothetical protein